MSSTDDAPTPRATPSRNPQRVSYDADAVHAVLDEALVSHVGFVVDGRPVVLPHLHARAGRALHLPGSTGARALLAARADGARARPDGRDRRARAPRGLDATRQSCRTPSIASRP